MRSEGRGEHAPKAEAVHLDDHDHRLAEGWAEKQSNTRKYHDRLDGWGQGLNPDRDVPRIGTIPRDRLPAYVGKLGEIAFLHFINAAMGRDRRDRLTLDDVIRARGDGGYDFIILGHRIDVKTRQHAEPSLVRASTERGRPTPLTANRYVFAHLDVARPEIGVRLLGWAEQSTVRACPVRVSPRGGHRNYEVPDRALEPMRRLRILAKEGA
jgi:hypothetical protein